MRYKQLVKKLFPFKETLFYLLIFSALIALFLRQSSCLPFHIDELGSWGISLGSLKSVIHKTLFTQGQGPTYFLLLSIWMKVFGDSEIVIRSLSLVLSLINLTVVYRIGKILFNKQAAQFLILAYIASPMFFFYELAARPYVLANLLLSIILFNILKNLNSNNLKLLIQHLILLPILILTHYFYFFCLPPLLLYIYLFSEPTNRKQLSIKFSLATLAGLGTALILPFHVFINKIGGLEEISSKPTPLFTTFVIVVLLSTHGITGLIGLIIEFTVSRRKDFSKSRNLKLFGYLATFFPYFCLYLSSIIFLGPFFLTRYFSTTLLFSSITLTAIIFSHTKFLRYFLVLVATIIFAYNSLTPMNFFSCKENGSRWDNQLASLLEQQKECKIYASSLYIEAQSPEKLNSPDYKDFIESPISYFYKGEFQVLPMSLSNGPMRTHFNSQILPMLTAENCLTMILNTRRLSNNTQEFTPISEELPIILEQLGFRTSNHSEIKINDYQVISALR